jgi:hypothetical protein
MLAHQNNSIASIVSACVLSAALAWSCVIVCLDQVSTLSILKVQVDNCARTIDMVYALACASASMS